MLKVISSRIDTLVRGYVIYLLLPGYQSVAKTIATGWSHKITTIIAIQDCSMLKMMYSKEEAEEIFNITGNIISGQVSGKTAKILSERFAKIFQDCEIISIVPDARLVPGILKDLNLSNVYHTSSHHPAICRICVLDLKSPKRRSGPFRLHHEKTTGQNLRRHRRRDTRRRLAYLFAYTTQTSDRPVLDAEKLLS